MKNLNKKAWADLTPMLSHMEEVMVKLIKLKNLFLNRFTQS